MIAVIYKDNAHQMAEPNMDYYVRVYSKFTGRKYVNLDHCWIVKVWREGSTALARNFFKDNPVIATDTSNENIGVEYLKSHKYEKDDMGWRYLKYICDATGFTMDVSDCDFL